jgi:hypothetical protein
MPRITGLTGTDTFETWFDKTNQIISSIGYTYGFGNTFSTNGVNRTVENKLRDFCNVRDFGAVGDGVTDDSLAFQNAYDFLRFTVPVGICSASPSVPARTGTIYIPRGRYLLNRELNLPTALNTCNTTGITGITCSVNLASALGVKFAGDGSDVSVITTTKSNYSTVFFAGPYDTLEFHDLAFQDLSGNTNTQRNCITLNGGGSGRRLYINRISTYGFNTILKYTCDVNEDTNVVSGSYFNGANTVVWSRNTQALVNRFVDCSWYGVTYAAFDIKGYEYLHVDSGTVIMPGTFLKISNDSVGAVAQYLVTNTKWEYEPKGALAGTSKVIELTGGAYVKFVNCGIAGGESKSDVYPFDLRGDNYIVELDGGQWGETSNQQAKIKIKAQNALGNYNNCGMICKNLASAPSANIQWVTGSQSYYQWPPVIFQNCKGIENIYLRGEYQTGGRYVGGMGGLDRNKNTKNANGFINGPGLSGATHTFSSYGQRVLVESVRVLIGDTLDYPSWNETMSVYAGNTLISQTKPTNTAPFVYNLISNPFITTEDVKVYIPTGPIVGAGLGGLVFVDTLSL